MLDDGHRHRVCQRRNKCDRTTLDSSRHVVLLYGRDPIHHGVLHRTRYAPWDDVHHGRLGQSVSLTKLSPFCQQASSQEPSWVRVS